MRILRSLAFGISLILAAATGLGADGAAPRNPQFGVDQETFVTVTSWDGQPSNGTLTWDLIVGTAHRFQTNSPGGFIATVRLPDGAIVTSFEADVCDTSASGRTSVAMLVIGGSALASVSTGNVETPGCGRIASPVLPHVVDNTNFVYHVTFENTTFNATTSAGAVRIGYKLLVSPGPVTPTFLDVPTSDPAYDHIEALVASGITAGCGGGNYCPDATLTRRQMAVFLAKALGLQWPVPAP